MLAGIGQCSDTMTKGDDIDVTVFVFVNPLFDGFNDVFYFWHDKYCHTRGTLFCAGYVSFPAIFSSLQLSYLGADRNLFPSSCGKYKKELKIGRRKELARGRN